MLYFWQGLSIGLAYAAPLGLQNLFVINSALNCRRRRALVTAFIVLFFDTTLSLACFFGVGAVMDRWLWLKMVILLLGGLVVFFIGLGLLRAKPPEAAAQPGALSLRQTIITACAVTWLNPQGLLDGTMLLGAFHASLPAGQEWSFIGGVTAASCLWFCSLTMLVSLFRQKFNARVLRGINIVCGAVIIFYAVKLLRDFYLLLPEFF